MRYRPEIDLLKGLAIIAVVGIHLLSSFSIDLSHSMVALSFNQIARYSVPLFVFLSGLGLASKYKQKKVPLLSFFKRRLSKIIPPYIIWSIIIFAIIRLSASWSSAADSTSMLHAILLGKADYQLYFVPMLFQLYLLFPLLLNLARKLSPATFIMITFAIQIIAFGITNHLQFSDQLQYSLSPVWLGYFTLGISIGLARLRRPISRNSAVISISILGIISIIFAVLNAQQLIIQGLNTLDATKFTRLPVLFYATTAIMTLYLVRHQLLKLPHIIRNPLIQAGKYSYTIYLSHTLVLRVITQIIQNPTLEVEHIVTLGVVAALHRIGYTS